MSHEPPDAVDSLRDHVIEAAEASLAELEALLLLVAQRGDWDDAELAEACRRSRVGAQMLREECDRAKAARDSSADRGGAPGS